MPTRRASPEGQASRLPLAGPRLSAPADATVWGLVTVFSSLANRPSNQEAQTVSTIPHSRREDATSEVHYEPPDDEISVIDWLASSKRLPAPYASFAVIDLTELIPAGEEQLLYMGNCIRNSKVAPSFLDRMLQAVGWSVAGAPLQPPRQPQARRGEFGEVLACEVLKHFYNYRIPIVKLRYQMDPKSISPWNRYSRPSRR
jgi:hypothetical protein